ncbi:MAG: HD domain-containing protein [Lachnospiraceae bacterium]|nr:HD domain-containing protein [Lachnospiraceae bacterium]
MIVYKKEQMSASRQGIYPNLGSMYNMIVRETREHMERVGRYSAFFYRVLREISPDLVDRELGEEFAAVCEEQFRLHDLGRVYIPVSVLNKVEALTDEEKQMIQNHTVYARDAVKAIYNFPYQGKLLGNFLDIALYHHERYDGKGYPEGRSGEDIPFGARICALADVFDGITSWKPYKTKQTSREKAKEIILSEAGKQFDPQLARTFAETISYLPE